MTSLSIIVPVYNETPNLQMLIERLDAIARRLEAEYGMEVRYVFVDDGSRDNSYDLLRQLDFGGRKARLLRFSRNFGKEAALTAGIDAATDCDAIIMMDADLQHPPEVIEEMVRIWRDEKVDTVYAYKESRRVSDGVAKAALSRIFYRIMNQGSRFQMTENAGDFRLISQRYANALRMLPESERFMKGLYGWVGFSQRGIPLPHVERERGQSSFSSLRLLALSFDAMTSFTTAPLRIMAFAGLLIACFSGLYGLYIIIERLFFPSSSIGLASILTLISFFGGLQMVFLGLIGEYVGKIVSEVKRRPSYVIADDNQVTGDGRPSQ
ncbi:glycosyltransferase family 2 protein [Rhizobium alvei]|uniref:Glycosyltransferase family 2 protein n=1 Tax=Rhizobium alvei TaxID=1132659 RepID=A0ABT8YMB2_9HYPH|nr:glycosyltransferase family 2 protein [Rhizobium alvei]MDO6964387.1 glycosyltransferase family 2 protein [Rhizobium alvei]